MVSRTATEDRPLLAATALFGVCGVVVALGMSLVETAWIRGDLGGAAPLLGSLGLAVCLLLPVGLAVGLTLGLVAGGIRAAAGGPLWARLRREPETDTVVAAVLLGAAVFAVAQAALVALFAARVAAAMARPGLAALSTGLVAGGGLVGWALVALPLHQLLRRHVASHIPRVGLRSVTVLGLLALGMVAAVVLVLGSMDWRVLRLGPWIGLSVQIAAVLVLGSMLWARQTGWSRPRTLALAVVLGVGLLLGAPMAGRRDATVAAASRGGLVLPLLISVARSLGDADGDDYPATGWFGGNDCNDESPAIHPGARDIPGNGIDENCHGGDTHARLAKARARQDARPSQRFDGNLLLVCIDTLRADKLGVMGNTDGLTPNLDRLARQGVLFSRTLAQGPNTPQSFPAIFTSTYPGRIPFRKQFVGYPQLEPAALTVFEVLSQHGVQTSAVTSHFYFKPMRGITQGVASWDNEGATNIKDSNKDISAPRIVPRAIARLEQLARAKQRFVLFVHLAEPHSTYVTHPEFPITRRGVAGLQQKYDFEIKFADMWLGKLLEGLKRANLAGSTAVVVFADHGESFGEHTFYFHGQALYNEVLHVPLVVTLPGPRAVHRVVEERVGLIDLAPTMLDLMGVPIPDRFQGMSLWGLVQGRADPSFARRRLGAVLMPYPAWPRGQQAMVTGRYKVLLRTTENRLEVYDLQRDPREQQDLALTQPDLASRLKQQLLEFAEEQM